MNSSRMEDTMRYSSIELPDWIRSAIELIQPCIPAVNMEYCVSTGMDMWLSESQKEHVIEVLREHGYDVKDTLITKGESNEIFILLDNDLHDPKKFYLGFYNSNKDE